MRRAPTIGQAAQRRPTLSNLRGILLGITLAGLASCQQETPPAQAAAAPAVTVAQPLALSITDWDEYTGRVEAVDSVEVRARVSGYLQSAHFTEGAIVQAGDLLFVIDPRPYQAALDEAKAGLARAEVQLQLARNDLKRAQNLY